MARQNARSACLRTGEPASQIQAKFDWPESQEAQFERSIQLKSSSSSSWSASAWRASAACDSGQMRRLTCAPKLCWSTQTFKPPRRPLLDFVGSSKAPAANAAAKLASRRQLAGRRRDAPRLPGHLLSLPALRPGRPKFGSLVRSYIILSIYIMVVVSVNNNNNSNLPV